MSKAKKIISMLLAVAMVLTVAPFSLMASAATEITYQAPRVSTGNNFSVDTSATTEVIRIAAAENNFSLGTKIVPATKAGIPKSEGTYRSVAYAGDTPTAPKVVFKITGATLSETPSIQSSLSDCSFSAIQISSSGGTTTYTWEIQSGTATVGTDVVFTITYKVGEKSFEAYAFSHVENILVMNGFLTYKRNDNSGDVARHSVAVQLQSQNMYSGMCQDSQVSNRKVGYINYASTNPAETNNLKGMGNADDLSTDVTAYASAAPNNSVTGEEQGVMIKSRKESTGTQRNMCYHNDTNKSESVVHIDKRKHNSLADLGMKLILQNGEKSDIGTIYAETVTFYEGHKTFGEEDGGFTSDANAAAIMSISGTGSGNAITSSDPYGSVILPFSGTGPREISDSEQQYSMIVNVYSNNDDRTNRAAGGINLDFYVHDTSDLYGMYTGALRGTGHYPCVTTPFLGTDIQFNKGVNPQASMYTTGWSEYETALKNAGKILVKPDATQTEINDAAEDLYFAYRDLGGFVETADITVEHYAQYEDGSTALLGVQGTAAQNPELMGLTYGSSVVAYPATIKGYRVVDSSPKTINFTGKSTDPTSVKFYYTPITYNLNIHLNYDVDGDGYNDTLTSKPAYDQEIVLNSLDIGTREFYRVEGFYTDQALTQKATDFNMPDDKVDLYVKWTPADINVNVVMLADGVELGTKVYTVTPVEGSTVNLERPSTENQPSYAGYLFADFYEDAGFETQAKWPRTYSVGDAHETIYAKMVNVNGKVIFESNGGSPVADKPFTPNVAFNAPEAPTKKGYTFAGWYKDNGTFADPVNWPVTLPNETGFIAYAKWDANQYTISFELGGSTTKYDTQEIAPIQGYADELINPEFYPNEPLKFGYLFDGWSLNGVRYEFDGTNKYPTENITLRAIWRATEYSAFADITSYEKLSGNYVETDKASVGDTVTFRMTTQTNFAVGSSVFIFMYDSNFFELANEGSAAFAVNRDNEYIDGINAKFNGVTDDSALPWPSMAREETKADGSTAYYKAMMIAIDPTITADDYYCAPLGDGQWLVEFQLKVKEGATGSGKVFMSNDWTRTQDNIMGTQFYGWAESEDESVADTYNNVVVPNLDYAYAIINLDEVIPTDTTVELDANGGAWADGTTKTYSGRAETEILEYVRPEYEGYHLPDTNAWKMADSDTYWAEGYYEKEGVVNAKYYAQWLPNEYTINYYVDGALHATETALYNELIPNQITAPDKTGYKIVGWAESDAEGAPAIDFATYKCPIGGADLYAIWGPKDDTAYTITIKYVVPASGQENSSVVNMTGTTDSIVKIVDSIPDPQEANTTYILVSELPATVATNFVYSEKLNTLPISATIAPDGTTDLIVWYEGKPVTATYNANGGAFANGDLTRTETVTWQSYLEGPDEEPVKDGFDFGGWSRTATGAAVNVSGSRVTANVTYYAVWTSKKYPVTFNANGGKWTDGLTEQTAELTFGSNIVKPSTDPVKEGYDFLGWATTANATAAESLGTMDDVNGKTFYAVYALTEYTVTYYVDGEETYVDNYHMGDSVTIRAAEFKEGYTFSGWKIGGTDAADFTMEAENVVIEGTFTANNYEVIFNATGGYFDGDTGATTKSVLTKFNTAINPPAQPSRNGYKFLGWAASAESTDKVTDYGILTTTEPVTFYALWEATTASYTINIHYMDTTGAYSETPDDSQTSSGLVGTMSPTYVPADVNGFTVDTENSVLSGMIDADEPLILTVKYKRNQWTLSKEIDGVVSEVGKLYFEEAITPPADPETEGYTFTGWSEMPEDGKMPNKDLKLIATWKAKSYTVTWNVDGATSTSTIEYGAPVQGTDPSKTGHAFAGWSWTKTADGSAATAPATMPAYDLTATATWTKNSYTITYRTYNGVYKTETVPYGDVIVLPEKPVREGHTFTGWQGYTEGMTMPANNPTFVAQWQINQYTVTYANTGDSTIPEVTANYNTEISAVSSPVKKGHSFEGWVWTKDEDGSVIEAPSAIPAYNVTATAQWQINQYKVTYANTGDSTIPEVKADYGTAIDAVAAPVKKGNTFNGWVWTNTDTGAAVDAPATIPDYNVTATAQWTVNSYDITWVDGESTTTESLKYGAAVTIEVLSKEGYTFNGWVWTKTEGATAETAPATMPDYDLTATASWTINQYKAVFNSGDGKFEDGTTSKDVMTDYGATPVAPAAPVKTGYTFAGWTPELAPMGINGATYTATFTAGTVDYTVETYTMDTEGAYGDPVRETESGTADTLAEIAPEAKTGFTLDTEGSILSGNIEADGSLVLEVYYIRNQYALYTKEDADSEAVKVADYYFEETVAKPADPAERNGYTFAGWEGYTDGMTMPAADTTLIGKWTTNEYTVTWDVDGETNEETYAYGAKITKPTDPEKEGYTFAGWSPEVPETQGVGNATYVAQWTINEYTITWSIDGAETTETYDYKESITVKDDPEKDFYTFEGWTWTNTKTGEVIAEFTEMPAYDVTITANFERVPVTLNLVSTSTAVIENVEEPTATLTGYIYGIESKLKTDALIANYLLVEGDGTLIVTPFKFNICGTGTKVELKDNVTGEIVETYYIVIFGDINGDSKVDSIDTGMMEDEVLGLTYWTLEGEADYEPWKIKAADIGGEPDENGKVGDGYVTASDVAAVRLIVLDGAEVDQTTGIVTNN